MAEPKQRRQLTMDCNDSDGDSTHSLILEDYPLQKGASTPPRCSEIDLSRCRRPGEPEHYRLATNWPTAPAYPLETVHFRFRTRYVVAEGRAVERHPHIFLLRVDQPAAAIFAAAVLSFFPKCARSWAELHFPEWFLPDRIVLKTRRTGDDMDDDEVAAERFDREVKAYDRLRPLQGVVVPRCFGVASYRGTRALVLADVGGHSLATPEAGALTLEQLSAMLQDCYRALHAFGVHQDDSLPGNFVLVDGKLMALDFEKVVFDQSADDDAYYMADCVMDVADKYSRLRRTWRFDGYLEAA